jgi:hypothetical protein
MKDETSDQPLQVSKQVETFVDLSGKNAFTFKEFKAVISINKFIFLHAAIFGYLRTRFLLHGQRRSA